MSTPLEIHPDRVGNDQVHAAAHVKPPGTISASDKAEMRRVIMRAANLGVKLHNRMTYTEDARRWSGITEHRRSILDQVPPYTDCSAFATWCYWDASRWLGLPDIVNGENWQAGYTGTMIQHGRPVNLHIAQPGDLCFYGAVDAPYHVAIYAGQGTVVSMGRPGAPEHVGVGPVTACRSYL